MVSSKSGRQGRKGDTMKKGKADFLTRRKEGISPPPRPVIVKPGSESRGRRRIFFEKKHIQLHKEQKPPQKPFKSNLQHPHCATSYFVGFMKASLGNWQSWPMKKNAIPSEKRVEPLVSQCCYS